MQARSTGRPHYPKTQTSPPAIQPTVRQTSQSKTEYILTVVSSFRYRALTTMNLTGIAK